jgi:AcrR family transcriptional regulator
MSQEHSPKGRGRLRGPRHAKRALVRGEAVVQRILAATMEELARVGYRALRVEDVAARAEVNKTTVYRRWPEKCALVRDALGCQAERVLAPVHTGSLRGDLLEMARTLLRLWSTPLGQGVVRMLVAEGDDAELADIKKALRRAREPLPAGVLADAVARGELTPDADLTLLISTFFAGIQHRVFFAKEPTDDAYLERLADLLLYGILRGAPAKEPPAPRRAAPAPAPRGRHRGRVRT